MKTEIKQITPELAESYLENNFNNRKVRDKLVNYYADQMLRDEWQLTGQGISISDDGRLIDGQHRLMAIVRSNKPQNMLVISNLPFSTFKVHDAGIARQACDILSIEGIKNSTDISAIIKKKFKFDEGFKSTNGGGGRKRKLLSNTQVLDCYNQHPEKYQKIALSTRQLKSKLKLYTISYLGGIMAHLVITNKHEYNFVYDFFYQLHYNKNVQNETINVLRDLLLKNILNDRKFGVYDTTCFIIKT